MKCIQKWFKKTKKPSKTPVLGTGQNNRKWAIIVPHTMLKGGASAPSGTDEYHYAIRMVNYLGLPFDTRDIGGVKGATKRLVKLGYNCSLEPHKNAFNGKAHGFEILVLKDDRLSYEVALGMCDNFKKKHPKRRLRHGNGIKLISKGDRGYYNLKTARKYGMQIALLSEAFFIDNPDEWLEPQEMASFWKNNLING